MRSTAQRSAANSAHRRTRRSCARSLLIGLLAANAGCDRGEPTQAVPSVPARFEVIRGGDQRGTVAVPLPDTVVVRIADAAGTPASGVQLRWTVLEGGGMIARRATMTDSAGLARQAWTLGTSAGEQLLLVEWVDPADGAATRLGTVSATALPGPVTELRRLVRSDTVFLGTKVAVSSWVAATDSFGNVVEHAPWTVAGFDGYVVGDSLLFRSEGIGTVTIGTGALNQSIDVTALLDLRKRTWWAEYSCHTAPTLGYGGHTGADSLHAILRSERVSYPGEHTGEHSDAVKLTLQGRFTYFFSDGAVVHSPVETEWFVDQRPGELRYRVPPGTATANVGTAAADGGRAYIGGSACAPGVWNDGGSVLRLGESSLEARSSIRLLQSLDVAGLITESVAASRVSTALFFTVPEGAAASSWSISDVERWTKHVVRAVNHQFAPCDLSISLELVQVISVPDSLRSIQGNKPGSWGGHPPPGSGDPDRFMYDQNERLTSEALTLFGYGKRHSARNSISIFFVKTVDYYIGSNLYHPGGLSFAPVIYHHPDDYPLRNTILLAPFARRGILPDTVDARVVAHELGHMLLNTGAHDPNSQNFMFNGYEIREDQCARMRVNAARLFGAAAVPDPGRP